MSEKQPETWRREHTTLASQLWYMYQQRLRTDLTIFVKDEHQSTAFPCHQVVVSRLSATLDNFINQACLNRSSAATINLRCDPQVFPTVLKFAYTDEVVLQSIKEAVAIHKLSKTYNIEQLALACEKYINCEFDADNVWQILDCPNIGQTLMAQLRWFLAKNTLACLQSEQFLSCSKISLSILTAMPMLSIDSELELVKAVLRWTEHQNGGRPLNPLVSKALLGPALKHVRFLALTAAEFSQHVANSGLLSKDESLDFLVELTLPSPHEVNVPDGMCAFSEQRKKPLAADSWDQSVMNDCSDGTSVEEDPKVEVESAHEVDVPAVKEKKEEKQERNESFILMPAFNTKAKRDTSKSPDPQEERSSQERKENGVARFQEEKNEPTFQVNVIRSIMPTIKNFSNEVSGPLDMNIEFCSSQPVKLVSVKLMSQINRWNASVTRYNESITVHIFTAGSNKVHLISGFLNENVEYGPAPLEVKFKKSCVIHARKRYNLVVKYKADGVYISECRSSNVFANRNVNVSFSSCENAKGLLHSMILLAY